MTVYLRKAEPSDLPDILAIIEDGRRTLQKSGIPQWQNGDGPNQEILAKDIDQQTCYILMVEDTLAGVGVLCSEIDPAYEAIFNGSWQPHSQTTYTAIHRVALKVPFKVKDWPWCFCAHWLQPLVCKVLLIFELIHIHKISLCST